MRAELERLIFGCLFLSARPVLLFLCDRLEAPLPVCMAPRSFPILQDKGGLETKKKPYLIAVEIA